MMKLSRHADRRGFTLVEVLVVMSLMSFVMLAMMSALRTSYQTELRIDQSAQRSDDFRVVNEFLHSVLGRVSMKKIGGLIPVGQSPYYFSGDSSEIVWQGVMPARQGVGGLYHFRLSIDHASDQSFLKIQYIAKNEAEVRPDWAGVEGVVLVKGIDAMSLRYLDALQEPPEWLSSWNKIDHLPGRISISLQSNSGTWPEIVIPTRILPGSDQSLKGPSFGPE